MTMMMAIPTVVMVVRMPHLDDDLGARRRYQRREEHQSEKSKTKFLHIDSDAQPTRLVVVVSRSIVGSVQHGTQKNWRR